MIPKVANLLNSFKSWTFNMGMISTLWTLSFHGLEFLLFFYKAVRNVFCVIDHTYVKTKERINSDLE